MKNKIAIIGGTGKAGRYVVQQLLSLNFQLKLLLRDSSSFQPEDIRVEVVKGDARDYDAIQNLLKGCNAVINAVGQTKGAAPVFNKISENVMRAMQKQNISRYILLTGVNVNTPYDNKGSYALGATQWMKEHYPETTKDKQAEFNLLSESAIDWTLIRLPLIELTEEKRGVNVSLEDCLSDKISATDLACFVVEQLSDDRFVRKAPFVAGC